MQSFHVIFVVGVVGCNHFISFSSFVYVMSCYCRLIRRRRVVGISMLLSLPTRHLMDAIVVGHRKRHQIASCTEFTQKKIHHADDDDDARHQAAQHHHHRPIAGRAPRRPCSDRSGCCMRPHGEQQMPTTRQHLLYTVVPASTAVFFGCRRYRDDASVDTEFFAR